MLKILRKIRNISDAKRRDELLKILPKDSICAEIGVYRGDNAKRILDLCSPKKLVLIDAWNRNLLNDKSHVCNLSQSDIDSIYFDVVKRFSDNRNVMIIRNDSAKAVSLFADGFFDWIYVDAGHDYYSVTADLEACRKKTKVIAGDDYMSADGKWGNDVILAVDDFVKKYGLSLQTFDDQYMIY